jgi:hypothetical protein
MADALFLGGWESDLDPPASLLSLTSRDINCHFIMTEKSLDLSNE